MNNILHYTMVVDIPINEESTKLYSKNPKLTDAAIDTHLYEVSRVMDKEGFITMERIFRMLKIRATPDCPHILFTDLQEWRYFEEEEKLRLFLANDFFMLPVFSASSRRRPPKLYEVKPESEDKEDGEEWRSEPKEPYESGETGKT